MCINISHFFQFQPLQGPKGHKHHSTGNSSADLRTSGGRVHFGDHHSILPFPRLQIAMWPPGHGQDAFLDGWSKQLALSNKASPSHLESCQHHCGWSFFTLKQVCRGKGEVVFDLANHLEHRLEAVVGTACPSCKVSLTTAPWRHPPHPCPGEQG